jgi:hypothetical protein
MALILAYNDGFKWNNKLRKYVKEAEPRIERLYTKFNFDVGKCRSYLDLHYPEITITDDIIARCRAIFFRILYNCDDWQIEDCIITQLRHENWPLLDKSLKLRLYIVLLYNEHIDVKCCIQDLGDSDASDYKSGDIEYIKLSIMLTNDIKYELFLTTWPDCSTSKILTTLTLISCVVLSESKYYNSGFPGEIAELIVCFAFAELHKIDNDEV